MNQRINALLTSLVITHANDPLEEKYKLIREYTAELLGIVDTREVEGYKKGYADAVIEQVVSKQQ